MQSYFIPTTIIFLVTLAIGYYLSHLLMKKRGQKLRGSELHTKVLMWIPIYVVFVLFVIGNQLFQVLVSGFIGYHMIQEVRSHISKNYPFLVTYYALLVGFGFVAIWLMSSVSIATTLGLVFASVYADVFSFFAGNYLGKHKLPGRLKVIDKSLESVYGQIVGAFVGLLLISFFVSPLSLWLVLPIAVGAIFGDLLNRAIKHLVHTDNWSNHIKGHGGYLDRFASMSFAALALYIVQFL